MGHIPFGYKVENGKAVIDETSAAKLKMLYTNYLSGMALVKAAKEAGMSGKQISVVSDGLLKVENNEVMILVDTAENPEDIDEARARRAEEQAREALKRANSNRDVSLATAELSRALSRIKASRHKHHL